MLCHDLGTLLVEQDDGVRSPGGQKPAALLAVLLANGNQRVSVDRIIEALWGPYAPSGATATLESHVARLRRVLEPGRPARTPPTILVNDSGGYRLVVEVGQVDSLLFEELAGEVRGLAEAADPTPALRRADEALSLWRGQPFEPFTDLDWAQPAVLRLQNLRDEVRRIRIDALLASGEVYQTITATITALSVTPLDEHLWAQLMLAQYRAGNVEESLATYRRARTVLAEELGVDPGSELETLHGRILQRDAGLATPVTTTAALRRRVGIGLPGRLTPLVGRDHDLRRLSQLVVQEHMVTVAGPAGSGKTSLAVEVARAVARSFPDGVCFVDLSTVGEDESVFDLVASSIGIDAQATDTGRDLLRQYAATRRMLLLLDNCEHVLEGVASVVRDLLGEASGCVVLATSREPVSTDGEVIWSLGPLPVPEQGDIDEKHPDCGSAAMQLFLARVRSANPGVLLDASDLRAATEICIAVDGLPLALELAAARVRSLSLAEIAGQVRADPSRLARLGRGQPDHRHNLFEAIEWSYRLLDPAQQALHRVLSVLPGRFPLSAAVGVATGVSDDPFDIADGLVGLVHRSLLTVGATARHGTGSSFAQLATVRSHAHRHLLAEGEADDVLNRRDEWARSLLGKRPRVGSLRAPAWYDELEECYPAVWAVLQRAANHEGDPELVLLGSGLVFFWYFRSRVMEACRWLEKAYEAALYPVGSIEDLVLRLRLAGALMVRYRPDLARRYLPDQVVLPVSGGKSSVLLAEALLGAAGGAWVSQDFESLGRLSAQLSALAATMDDEDVRLFADVIECVASLPLGRFEETGARADTLYSRAVQIGNLHGSWLAALVRCVVASETVQPDDALTWTRRVVEVHARLGSGGSRVFLEVLGNCLASAGSLERAVRFYSATHALSRQAGSPWPEHPRTRELFALARAGLDTVNFDRAWHDGRQRSLTELIIDPGRAG